MALGAATGAIPTMAIGFALGYGGTHIAAATALYPFALLLASKSPGLGCGAILATLLAICGLQGLSFTGDAVALSPWTLAIISTPSFACYLTQQQSNWTNRCLVAWLIALAITATALFVLPTSSTARAATALLVTGTLLHFIRAALIEFDAFDLRDPRWRPLTEARPSTGLVHLMHSSGAVGINEAERVQWHCPEDPIVAFYVKPSANAYDKPTTLFSRSQHPAATDVLHKRFHIHLGKGLQAGEPCLWLGPRVATRKTHDIAPLRFTDPLSQARRGTRGAQQPTAGTRELLAKTDPAPRFPNVAPSRLGSMVEDTRSGPPRADDDIRRSPLIAFQSVHAPPVQGALYSHPSVTTTPEAEQLLANGCVVAVGVSGGKDSQACAIAVARYLDEVGHTGPRVLVHSDLGRVEWKDSGPNCERLAAALGWELMVVRRKAGDMLDRWEARWASSVKRYAELACVKLILPWSTPQMRFCTSELKVDQITAALKKRFRDLPIINASGIRRQESATRARMPVTTPMAKLQRQGLPGLAWNPIIDWTIDEVWASIQDAGLEPHEAYSRYGASRVSCAFCIMSTEADLRAAAGCPDNDDLYRLMVDLEARSTFAFQGARWLADVAPELLGAELRARIERAKAAAAARVAAETEIPAHLLYTAGWPTEIPSIVEAKHLASVRRRVSEAVGIEVQCTTGASVRDRYAELLAARVLKAA